MLYQYVGYNGSRVRARGETYPRGPGAIKPIIEHVSASEPDFYFEFQECCRRLCGRCTQCRLTSEVKQFKSTSHRRSLRAKMRCRRRSRAHRHRQWEGCLQKSGRWHRLLAGSSRMALLPFQLSASPPEPRLL